MGNPLSGCVRVLGIPFSVLVLFPRSVSTHRTSLCRRARLRTLLVSVVLGGSYWKLHALQHQGTAQALRSSLIGSSVTKRGVPVAENTLFLLFDYYPCPQENVSFGVTEFLKSF